MIGDFHEFPDGAVVSADVRIVGAGAAGITVALEFIGNRYSVTLLESGGLEPEAETQRLYDGEILGLAHDSVEQGRARIFGGTTTLWGGQALRFDDIDFEKRSWVTHSGWPICGCDLRTYYERAERVLQIEKPIVYRDLCASFRVEPPAFDSGKLAVECSQWSPRPNFGQEYREEIRRAQNISAILHANVTGIITNSSATSVEKIEFQTLGGKKGIAKARYFIICCGGIETARLLLASDRVEACGVGNRSDLVGRYYQEHPMFWYGRFQAKNRGRLQNLFESFYRKGLKYFPIVKLSKKSQAEKQLLNIQGSITLEQTPGSAILAMKELFRAVKARSCPGGAELRRYIRDALKDPGELTRLAYRLHVQNRAATPQQGAITFGGQCEMAPNPESRVMLSRERDALGMPRVRLDWRLSELERRTAREYINIVAGEFERLGLGTFDLAPLNSLSEAGWDDLAHDSSHHMGTARMHESSRCGVVDSDCRVHGISNLFIGSSAVFPTSSRSNPTMTILALSIRIADRVKQMI
jgi:choline dehydrogenase-like flavoprotein